MSRAAIVQTIAKHPRYDLAWSDGGTSRLLFRKASSELIGLIYEGEKPQVMWLDPGFAAVQKVMDNTFADHVNLPVDWSETGNTFIYFSFSDQDPGTYYVFRPLESKLIPILALGDRLKGKVLARTVPIDFAARDGAQVHGYVTYPPDSVKGPSPLVVQIHGGPTVRDSWGFDAMNQFLATRGYVVLQVNYRGSSGYGAAYQLAGLRSRLDTVVIDDIADGVRHLILTSAVDPARIAVMGGSFGGWATYMSLIKYPDLYRAGIAIAAVSHWRKELKHERWGSDIQIGYSFWKSLLDYRDFEAEERFIDPYLRAAEIKQPVYIMHGGRDEIVPPAEAQIMLKELQKHNDHVESRSFPNAGHGGWSFEDRVVELNEVETFLSRYLGKTETAELAAAGAD